MGVLKVQFTKQICNFEFGMNQKTKDIQKRYDGFLQTAGLWKNDVVFDLQHFELPF